MDKRLILAVAGSGKTTKIIDSINADKRFLIVTYTESNYKNIQNAIIKRFNMLPDNIKIFTYFSFLYIFCFRPFQTPLKTKCLSFGEIPTSNRRWKSNDVRYYMNIYSEKMYHSRLAKLCLERKIDLIKQRLEKYFDYLYVDEVQDFAANDFNFILGLYNTNINILMVGDFYQHTFDTSRDGNTNSNLYNNYNNYLKRFTNANKSIVVDTTSLTKSKRCPKNVCDFVRENLKIHIESDIPNSIISEITKEEEIDKIICDNSIVKLFYSNSKKFLCNGDNWGNSKGKTYANVCVVLNKKSYELYIDNKLHESAQATLNKLYVACTRTKNNLYFIEEAKLVKYKKLEE